MYFSQFLNIDRRYTMFRVRTPQIPLRFVVYSVLTRYTSTNSFLSRCLGSCSVFCWQGVVSSLSPLEGETDFGVFTTEKAK